MLTKLTKGQQMTIPAQFRKELAIDEHTLLDIEIDKKRKKITIEPIKSKPLKELYKEWDKVKFKTKKSLKEVEEDYERENPLH